MTFGTVEQAIEEIVQPALESIGAAWVDRSGAIAEVYRRVGPTDPS